MNIFSWIGCIVLALAIYWVAFGYYKITISKKLVEKAEPFHISGTDYTKTLLVLGDSTAAGVGADTATSSVPGRVASYLNATYVENRAVSGALVSDISKQMESVKRDSYDVVLLQVGGNDIVRFHSAEKVSKEIEPILVELKKKSSQVIFVSAGNVGSALLIPPPLRPFYTRLTLKYHKAFEEVTEKTGVTYINLYVDPSIDPFVLNPGKYLAEDSFHPSSSGYEIWFKAIQAKLEK